MQMRAWGLIVVCAALLIGVAQLYRILDPLSFRWFPHCPVKLLTGLSCPACGSQRALHALLNGQWVEAVHYNFFLLLSVPYVALLFLAWTGRRYHVQICPAARLEGTYAAWGYIIVFFLWFIIRNILNI